MRSMAKSTWAEALAVVERAVAEPWDVTRKMLAYLIERADALAAHADNARAEGRA